MPLLHAPLKNIRKTEDEKAYNPTPFSSGVVAPLVEEGIFRVGLQSYLFPFLINMVAPSPYTPVISLGLASLAFGWVHCVGQQGARFKAQAIGASLVGVVYGGLYNTVLGISPDLCDMASYISPEVKEFAEDLTKSDTGSQTLEAEEPAKKGSHKDAALAVITAHSVHNTICSVLRTRRFWKASK